MKAVRKVGKAVRKVERASGSEKGRLVRVGEVIIIYVIMPSSFTFHFTEFDSI
jgi:hypothetical protein